MRAPERFAGSPTGSVVRVGPHLLANPFMRREAVLSSRIEGTQAGVDDLYAFEAGQLELFGGEGAAPASDAREVFNYLRALEYGLDRVRTIPVCLRLMRELHAILLAGVRGQEYAPGEFRSRQNWIGGRGGRTLQQADYVPPPPTEVDCCLKSLEQYINATDEIPPLVRIGIVHVQFEMIHPFMDGNGRIGRLLIVLLLAAWNLLPAPLLYPSEYFEERREEYYDLLLGVSERGNWCEWLEFFLKGLATHTREAISRAKTLQNLQSDFRGRLARIKKSSLPLKLMENLFASPLVTVERAKDILGVTYESARVNVAKLTDLGILKPMNLKSRRKWYVCEDIMNAVTDPKPI